MKSFLRDSKSPKDKETEFYWADTLRFHLKFFNYFSIILDTEINKFPNRKCPLYDAALLIRCYTQQALHIQKLVSQVLSSKTQISFQYRFNNVEEKQHLHLIVLVMNGVNEKMLSRMPEWKGK